MTAQSSRGDQRPDPVEVAANYGSVQTADTESELPVPPKRPSPGRHAATPESTAPPEPDPEADRGWSIGDAGRAFAEVEPVLGDAVEGPDTIADGGTVGSVYVLAASVRGLSHRQNGTPRQDSYGYATTPDGRWLILVVADGVSAGRLSHRAAQLVTRHGPGLVAAEIDRAGDVVELNWYGVFQQLAGRIVSVGQKLLAGDGAAEVTPQQVSDAMATTATIVVMELSPTGPLRRLAVAWQGDSPAWRLWGDRWECLTEIKNEGKEIASSSVMALPRLPSEPDMQRCQRGFVPVESTVLVMTDGVGDPLGAADGAVGSALAEAWRTPPTLFRFAEQVAFGRKSFDDDRTVVAVWSRSGP